MRWRPDGVVMKQFAIHMVLLAKGDLATRRPMQSHQAADTGRGIVYQVVVSPVFLEALLRETEHPSPRNRFDRESRGPMIDAAIGLLYLGNNLLDSPLRTSRPRNPMHFSFRPAMNVILGTLLSIEK